MQTDASLVAEYTRYHRVVGGGAAHPLNGMRKRLRKRLRRRKRNSPRLMYCWIASF